VTVAVIFDPNNPANGKFNEQLVSTALTRHLKLRFIPVDNAKGFDAAFDIASREAQATVVLANSSQATVVLANSLTMTYRKQIAELAKSYRVPAMYALGEFVDAGGLMAYGPDQFQIFRRAAEYVDKILGGASAGELPIEQPTQFKLMVNLKTAKALGLVVPDSILLRAEHIQ